MSDIVDRLRSELNDSSSEGLMEDAAKEIERLRVLLGTAMTTLDAVALGGDFGLAFRGAHAIRDILVTAP